MCCQFIFVVVNVSYGYNFKFVLPPTVNCSQSGDGTINDSTLDRTVVTLGEDRTVFDTSFVKICLCFTREYRVIRRFDSLLVAR